MKNNTVYLFFLVAIIFLSACSDDFLNENKKEIDGYNLNIPLYVEPVSDFTEVSITVAELKNKDFKVIQFPKHIHFETFKGRVNDDGVLSLNIKVDKVAYLPISDRVEELGYIVLNIDNFGQLGIEVLYLNLGTPQIEVDQVLDFGLSRRPKQFSINNRSDEGYLLFQIVEAPSWLRSEILPIHEPATVGPTAEYPFHLYVEPIGLPTGVHEGKLVILSNDPDSPEITVTLKMTVPDEKNFYPITGSVVDCEFSKTSNRLYVAQPHKILIYNTLDMTVTEKPFSEEIHRISFSEDEKTLLLAQNGFIRAYNASDFSLKHEIQLDYNVTDVVDGENGYYYFSADHHKVCSYHLLDGTIFVSSGYTDHIEGDKILKIKGEPLLLITANNMGQTGVTRVNISEGKQIFMNDWFIETHGLWATAINDKIIAGSGKVYPIPYSQADELLSENRLEFPYDDLDYTIYHWIDENSATGSIWGAFNCNRTVHDATIVEWDPSSYKIIRKIPVSDHYTTIDNKSAYYPFMPKYIFTNKSGEKLYTIKSAYTKEFPYFAVEYDHWHIEVIDISN